jgi:ubiquitin C-terminal hydrolase
MIIHVGFKTRAGHYYTLIRHKNGWLKFDDEKVTLIENPQTFFKDSQKAYILFYQKKWVYDEDPASEPVQISVNLPKKK